MKENMPDMSQRSLTPIIMADIAIKALKGENIQQIAEEYKMGVTTVHLLQNILEANAVDLFLPGIEGKSLYRIFDEIKGQLYLIERLVEDASEVIGMRNGEYFSE